MLSKEENELITRVGPGTPMGNAMRRYWIPACLSCEIAEPDCPPVRVKLLGEDLVAFRDTEGRIGLVDEFCPHRRVSLYFGRNEECGLRCVYHGWKFDVEGNCLDQLNEPPEHQFKQHIHLTAYPTVELGGLVWAYLGPADKMPPPPKFAWTQVPESRRHVSKVIEECNWLQALEGGIDTSHAPILHRLLTDNSTRGGIKPSSPFVRGKAPKLRRRRHRLRLSLCRHPAARRRARSISAAIISSCRSIRSARRARIRGSRAMPATSGCRWMTTTAWSTTGCTRRPTQPLTEEDRRERGIGNGPDFVDQTTFRSKQNRSNNYGLNREVQRTESYTGIDGINQQDRALQESMGRSSTARRSIWAPATRRSARRGACCARRSRRCRRAATRPAPAPATTTSGPAKRYCRATPTGTRWRPTSPRTRFCRPCRAGPILRLASMGKSSSKG